MIASSGNRVPEKGGNFNQFNNGILKNNINCIPMPNKNFQVSYD